jgi:hypothetical protein
MTTIRYLLFFMLAISAWIKVQAQQKISATFSHEQRYYFYVFELTDAVENRWNLNIHMVSNANSAELAASNVVYSTDAFIHAAGQRVTHVRILGATPLDYSWAVSRGNYHETAFYWSQGQVSQTVTGKRMSDPEIYSALPDNQRVSSFNPRNTTFNGAVDIAAKQFIMQYHKLFRFPDAKVPDKAFFQRDFVHKGAKYNYELRRDFFTKGDDNLSIRKEGQGLVYNTLVRMEEPQPDSLIIHIHFVIQKGLAWSVYANDFASVHFNLRNHTLRWSKTGTDMPANVLEEKLLQTFPQNASISELIHIAVTDFAAQYSKAFSR